MYSGKIVRLGENDKYVLGKYLASGLIATVFPAWKKERVEHLDRVPSVEDDGTPDKAVKVPAPRLDDALTRRFWSEFNVLEAAQKKWRERFGDNLSPFPRSDKGNLDDKEVLVLEFVPDDWAFGKALNARSGLEKEKLALQGAVQYARMLQALHQAGYVCLDRKSIDLFFDESSQRLIVLDWNVVEDFDKEKVVEEHGIFATMWYSFLTGKVPPPHFNPLDDEIWGDISLGTRRLLADLFLGRDVQDDAGLVKKLETWLVQFDVPADQLLQQAPDKADIRQREKSGQPVADLYWKGLALRDLARRRNGAHQEAYEAFRQHFEQRFSRRLFDAQMALLNDAYDEGVRTLENMASLAQEDPAFALLRERWRVLLQAARDARDRGRAFYDVSRAMQDWMKAIEEKEPTTAAAWRDTLIEYLRRVPLDDDAYLSASPDVDDGAFDRIFKFHPLLTSFWVEAEIRQMWDEFEQYATDSRGDAISREHYRQMLKKLEGIEAKLKVLPAEYAEALRALLFPDLEARKQRIARRAASEKAFYTLEQQANKAFGDMWGISYLRYRLQDVQNLADLNEIRDTVRFLDALLAGGAVSAGKAGAQWIKNEITNVTETLIREPDSDIQQLLQNQVKNLLEQGDGDVRNTLLNAVADLVKNDDADVRQALLGQVETLLQQEAGDVHNILVDAVTKLVVSDPNVKQVLEDRVRTLLDQGDGTVRTTLVNAVTDLVKNDYGVKQLLRGQVEILLQQDAGGVHNVLVDAVAKLVGNDPDVKQLLEDQVKTLLDQGDGAVRTTLVNAVTDLVKNDFRVKQLLQGQVKSSLEQDEVKETLQQQVESLLRQPSKPILGIIEKKVDESIAARKDQARQVIRRFASLVQGANAEERLRIWADEILVRELGLALNKILSKYKPGSTLPSDLQKDMKIIRASLSISRKDMRSSSWKLDKKTQKEWEASFADWIDRV